MKAAWLAQEADKVRGAATEIHHKPTGQIVVGCKVKGKSPRYFEITVETDGSLSLAWTLGAQIVRVTNLGRGVPC